LPSEIAARANENGWHKQVDHTSTMPWTARRIIKMLNNRHFIGDIRYGDTWIPGQHEPLVDLERCSKARMQTGSRRHGPKSKSKIHQIRFLKVLIPCPECGRKLSVSSKTRRRKGGGIILFSDYCCRSTSGQLVPKIVEFVTIDEANVKITVRLKPDALDYLMT